MTAGVSLGFALRLAVPSVNAMSPTGSAVEAAMYARYVDECAAASAPVKRAEAGLLTQLNRMRAKMFAMQLTVAYFHSVALQWRTSCDRAGDVDVFSDSFVNEAIELAATLAWAQAALVSAKPAARRPTTRKGGDGGVGGGGGGRGGGRGNGREGGGDREKKKPRVGGSVQLRMRTGAPPRAADRSHQRPNQGRWGSWRRS